MIDELKEIIEYAFYNMLKLDDTINSPSDIYDLILMIDDIDGMDGLNKDTFYESKRSMLFDNMCCSMLPKPTNLKEQIKYLDICKLLNYRDEFITKDLEFGKEYDVKKYRYVSLNSGQIIEDYELTEICNDPSIPFIINLSNGILKITLKDEDNPLPIEPQAGGTQEGTQEELRLYSTLKSISQIL